MDIFTVKCTSPDGEERIFHHCTFYKGKIAQVDQKGIGEKKYSFNGIDDVDEYYNNYKPYYKPVINSDLLQENGLSIETVKEIIQKDPENIIDDPRIFNCMFTLGINKGGKICINLTEQIEKAQEQKQEKIERDILRKEIPISFDKGIFGLTINLRLPQSVWTLISESAQFHKRDISDEEWAEDMGYYDYPANSLRGWFYSVDAIDKLVNAGYSCTFMGYPVMSSADIQKVYIEMHKVKAEADRQAKLREQEKQEILEILHRIWKKGKSIEKSEADAIAKLPRLLFESLEITGANIYGGGKWLYDTEHSFYYVCNNGMDGDDWSLNNFPTGGAGAICRKVEKPDADVNEFIRRANSFT